MKTHVFRTAMCGGGLSYDVYVPTSECPAYVLEAHPGGSYYTRICRDGKEYLDYEHATLSQAHIAMDQGWDKYQDYLAHEKKCRREMLVIAQRAFPELARVADHRNDLPTLWVNGLMPKETSAFAEISA
jgi:hypothetical protein